MMIRKYRDTLDIKISTAFLLSNFIYIYNIDCLVFTLSTRSIFTSYLAYIQLIITYLFTIIRKSRLSKRSVDTLIRLARRTYLRYSKRISKEPIHRYKFKDYKKYDTYLRKYKDYNLISISLLFQRR
jgi:hypothetical protein